MFVLATSLNRHAICLDAQHNALLKSRLGIQRAHAELTLLLLCMFLLPIYRKSFDSYDLDALTLQSGFCTFHQKPTTSECYRLCGSGSLCSHRSISGSLLRNQSTLDTQSHGEASHLWDGTYSKNSSKESVCSFQEFGTFTPHIIRCIELTTAQKLEQVQESNRQVGKQIALVVFY